MLGDRDGTEEGNCGSESGLSGCEERASVAGKSEGVGDMLPFVWDVGEGELCPETGAGDAADDC